MKKQRMNSMPRTLACIAIAITLAYSAIVYAGSGDAEQEPYQTYTHCVREGETIWSIAGQDARMIRISGMSCTRFSRTTGLAITMISNQDSS